MSSSRWRNGANPQHQPNDVVARGFIPSPQKRALAWLYVATPLVTPPPISYSSSLDEHFDIKAD
ncbi:hypothetical protein EMIT043CA1_10136 [Pseudomonas brassicacearum]